MTQSDDTIEGHVRDEPIAAWLAHYDQTQSPPSVRYRYAGESAREAA